MARQVSDSGEDIFSSLRSCSSSPYLVGIRRGGKEGEGEGRGQSFNCWGETNQEAFGPFPERRSAFTEGRERREEPFADSGNWKMKLSLLRIRYPHRALAAGYLP